MPRYANGSRSSQRRTAQTAVLKFHRPGGMAQSPQGYIHPVSGSTQWHLLPPRQSKLV